jgi:transcriptional regulator with XRE-family HTH domain
MSELERAVAARLRSVMSRFEIVGNRALADICGTTPSAVNNWLSAYNLPRIPEMIRLCERTGVTLDWLYRGGTAEPGNARSPQAP